MLKITCQAYAVMLVCVCDGMRVSMWKHHMFHLYLVI
jgi:hypothetical protein